MPFRSLLLIPALMLLNSYATAQIPSLDEWAVHDLDRPQPAMVAPGAPVSIAPPSDAIVLFDGTDLSQWEHLSGEAASWTIYDGYMEVAPRSGSIRTRDGFGDVQLHVEWSTPNSGSGQDSGNSGVYLMSTYEVQVLNSYGNETYPDGQAAAIYGQYPPLVNASRPPDSWQSYDIVFRRPRFGDDGELASPARLTVFHNGVLVQDNVTLTGPTGHYSRPPYAPHEDRLPIVLQDHNEPTRYRNIWIRNLE